MTEKVVTQAFTLALKANAFVAGLREAARDAKTGKGSAAGKATKPEESKK